MMEVGVMVDAPVTRAEVEDFLYREAALLDEWKLDEWLSDADADDACYYVPPNDHPEGDPPHDAVHPGRRHRAHPRAHHAHQDPELPRRVSALAHPADDQQRTHRRLDGDLVTVAANFVCYRYRRYERIREYVGAYRYVLKRAGDGFKIKERRVLIDAHELGTLGSVSFIL